MNYRRYYMDNLQYLQSIAATAQTTASKLNIELK